jgi:DNA-binding beta-propeller fold protein YncE
VERRALSLKLRNVAIVAVAFLSWSGGAFAQAADERPAAAAPKVIDAPVLPYDFVQRPAAPAPHRMGSVTAVALTPVGNLIVLNRNPEIMMLEYDPAGRFVRTFNPNVAGNPHGLRIDRHGHIWVTDSFLNVVWKLNPKGEPLMTVGKRGEIGPWVDQAWNGMLNQPVDVAFDQDDNLYIVQGHGSTALPAPCTLCASYAGAKMPVLAGSDPRIMKFDSKGKFLKSLALPHASGPYPTLHTVVVTRAGEVWIGDRQLNKIIVLDRELRRLREIQQPAFVSGLSVGRDGAIWMAAGHDGMVMKLDQTGKVVGWVGKPGRVQDPESNLIGEAHFLAVTPDEQTIYLADTANAKVHRLERN